MTTAADAQTAACLQLVNELAALDSGGGFSATSGKYREYDRAVREQRAQIAKTESASRRNGCVLAGLFKIGVCGRIKKSLDQMYENLRQLELTRANYAPTGGRNSARRTAILREIQRNGCQYEGRSRDFAVQRQPSRPRSLLEQIFGVRTYREDGYRSRNDYDPDTGLASRYGTFRTLCVRSCDGYYFPISFSTVAERFSQDEQTCQSMCPGAEVELYFHRMPSQDSEDMISYRTDMPYTDLPAAFNYRKSFDPQCSCRTAGSDITELTSDGYMTSVELDNYLPAVSEPTVGTPVFRIDPWLNPETLLNAEGDLTLAALKKIASPEAVATPTTERVGGKTIRIVGPSFFPVQ